MKMTTRTIEIMVLPEGEPIFSEHGTNVKIDDDASGELVIVTQHHRTESGIAIDPAEWPVIRDAIDKMIKECRGVMKVEQIRTENEAAGGLSDLTDVLAADSKRALELLGSIFYCGNFIAETRNEQELEILMRKLGYFIETEAQFDAHCQRAPLPMGA